MKMNPMKIMTAVGAVAIVALAGLTLQVHRERNDLVQQLSREKTRLEQIERKYKEGKQQAEALLRVKASLEGSQRARESEMEKAVSDLESQAASLKAGLGDANRRLAAVTGERDKLNRDLADLKALQRKTGEELEKTAEAKQALEKAKKGVEDKLKKTEQELDRARAKNGELCAIALDLLAKYKNKGILGAVADKEPLTQIGRAKLEENVQEYRDKIEAAKINTKPK